MSTHSIEEGKLLEQLKVHPGKGLSLGEAKARLQEHGANVIAIEKGPSAFRIFLRQFKNVLIIILLAAAFLSGLVGEAIDAWFILIIVVLSAGLGFVQEFRAEKAVELFTGRG